MFDWVLNTPVENLPFFNTLAYMNEKTNLHDNGTAQKMKFSVKDFFSKCDQILN